MLAEYAKEGLVFIKEAGYLMGVSRDESSRLCDIFIACIIYFIRLCSFVL